MYWWCINSTFLVHEEGNRELLPIDGEGIQTSS